MRRHSHLDQLFLALAWVGSNAVRQQFSRSIAPLSDFSKVNADSVAGLACRAG